MPSQIQTLSKLLADIEALRASCAMPDDVLDLLTKAGTETFAAIMALQPEGPRDVAAMLSAVAAYNNDDDCFDMAMVGAIDACRAGAERVARSF